MENQTTTLRVDIVTADRLRELAQSKKLKTASFLRVVAGQLHRQEFPEKNQGFGADPIRIDFEEGVK